MKIRFLIVDDEPLARKLIASHASKVEDLELAGECGNALEASNFLRANKVDLIFLDIQMPEISGLQFVRTLKNPPAVILTTAFRDFAPEAFDIEAIDYLLKPIALDRFLKAMSRFMDRQNASDQTVVQTDIQIKSDRQFFKVKLDDILFIESLDDYVKVHLDGRFIVTRENITAFNSRLPSEQFVRIHRSFIVNVRHVRSVSMESVKLADHELQFGRAFRKEALARLNIPL
jgi:DNA-binding LytR/AlgR family response regulator